MNKIVQFVVLVAACLVIYYIGWPLLNSYRAREEADRENRHTGAYMSHVLDDLYNDSIQRAKLKYSGYPEDSSQ